MIVFLGVVVVCVIVGITALALRNRTERGIESGISSFRRELDALAPRGDPKAGPAARRPDRPRAQDDSDADDPEVRTVQIGDRPPPRRLGTPGAVPSGSGPAAENDDAGATPDHEPTDGDDEGREVAPDETTEDPASDRPADDVTDESAGDEDAGTDGEDESSEADEEHADGS